MLRATPGLLGKWLGIQGGSRVDLPHPCTLASCALVFPLTPCMPCTEGCRRLRVTQRAMERAILGVSLIDHTQKCTEMEISRRTRVTDIAQRVAKLKWQWAGGHVWGPKVLE
ncbi:jg24065 [Pararge aegeria aegeria]|uniref:Jg24065 protein n=1 Tax=Pararge aegeria aegeria TaxID=348720 RepID=A0A8S4R166_9NEOP|nr:jg24065 [Pararge aegeria aegeria]